MARAEEGMESIRCQLFLSKMQKYKDQYEELNNALDTGMKLFAEAEELTEREKAFFKILYEAVG